MDSTDTSQIIAPIVRLLLRGDDWRRLVIDRTDIRQADLSSGNRSSTRVRIKDAEIATLTVKRAELQGIEVEYSISVADAE